MPTREQQPTEDDRIPRREVRSIANKLNGRRKYAVEQVEECSEKSESHGDWYQHQAGKYEERADCFRTAIEKIEDVLGESVIRED